MYIFELAHSNDEYVLKPCPFCGSKAELLADPEIYGDRMIICKGDCRLVMRISPTWRGIQHPGREQLYAIEERLINQWNNRR